LHGCQAPAIRGDIAGVDVHHLRSSGWSILKSLVRH
jgi:hypothetical protein